MHMWGLVMFLRIQYFIIVFCTLFFVACTSNSGEIPPANKKEEPMNLEVVPMDKSAYAFVEVLGFLKKDWILINCQNGDQFELVSRDLLTGTEKIIYRTFQPIIMATSNSDGSQILVQESQSDKLTNLCVISEEGEIIWEKEYDSMEMQWYWNPFQPSEVYIQSFGQDWSFRTERLNTQEGILENIPFDYSFFQWASADEMVYLDWDLESPKQTANLVKRNMKTNETEMIAEHCYAFSIVDDVLTTFTIEEKNHEVYTNITSKKEESLLFFYQQPLVESFSENLLVPNFAYGLLQNGLFFYEIDESSMTQQLVLGTKDGVLQMKQPFQEALPIVVHPESSFVLAGYQKEWVLNTDTQKWFSLFQQ